MPVPAKLNDNAATTIDLYLVYRCDTSVHWLFSFTEGENKRQVCKRLVNGSMFCARQWFAINHQHAPLVVANNLYYRTFSSFCNVIEE